MTKVTRRRSVRVGGELVVHCGALRFVDPVQAIIEVWDGLG
jgi:hypothetical protein